MFSYGPLLAGKFYTVQAQQGSPNSGPCKIEATIPDFSDTLLPAEVAVEVVVTDHLSLQESAYDASQFEENVSAISSGGSPLHMLHRIGCGVQNYQQVILSDRVKISSYAYCNY